MIYTLTQQNQQYNLLYGLHTGLSHFLADGVTVNPTPTYVNDMTGTVQVLNPAGVPQVIGPAGATTTPAVYVAGTNGNYTYLITKVFYPPVGPGYKIMVDLATPSGLDRHWEFDAVVEISKKLTP
jgi:hypothetical protein